MMKPTIVVWLFLIALFFGCNKKRSANDYHYYQPYKKNVFITDSSNNNVIKADTLSDGVLSNNSMVEKFAGKGVSTDDYYFIVVANYVNQDNALKRKELLIKQGFKPEIFMVNNDGWYKLAVQSYKTLPEAELGLKKMIDNKIVPPDTYIVFNRNKQ